MDRRTVLAASLAVFGGALAGCTVSRGNSDDPGDGSGNTDMTDPADDSGDVPPPTDTDGDVPPPTDGGSTLESELSVLGTSAGSTDGDVSVTVSDGRVTVTGTITGANSCHTARLGPIDFEDGTLVVRVESYEDAADDVDCRPVETGIDYEVAIETGGDRPRTVRVEHDGRLVAAVTPE